MLGCEEPFQLVFQTMRWDLCRSTPSFCGLLRVCNYTTGIGVFLTLPSCTAPGRCSLAWFGRNTSAGEQLRKDECESLCLTSEFNLALNLIVIVLISSKVQQKLMEFLRCLQRLVLARGWRKSHLLDGSTLALDHLRWVRAGRLPLRNRFHYIQKTPPQKHQL